MLLTALAVDLKSDSIISCRVEDVSESGARIKLAERRFLPPTFWLIAVTSGLAFSVKTIWRKDVRLGIETGPPVDLADPGSRDERRLSKIWAARR